MTWTSEAAKREKLVVAEIGIENLRWSMQSRLDKILENIKGSNGREAEDAIAALRMEVEG